MGRIGRVRRKECRVRNPAAHRGEVVAFAARDLRFEDGHEFFR